MRIHISGPLYGRTEFFRSLAQEIGAASAIKRPDIPNLDALADALREHQVRRIEVANNRMPDKDTAAIERVLDDAHVDCDL